MEVQDVCARNAKPVKTLAITSIFNTLFPLDGVDVNSVNQFVSSYSVFRNRADCLSVPSRWFISSKFEGFWFWAKRIRYLVLPSLILDMIILVSTSVTAFTLIGMTLSSGSTGIGIYLVIGELISFDLPRLYNIIRTIITSSHCGYDMLTNPALHYIGTFSRPALHTTALLSLATPSTLLHYTRIFFPPLIPTPAPSLLH
uniref:Uncharacterized protein n=1 Tax=Timema poppense TaxID=170557 RepID=A0A7R9D9Q6_TIMPO|nr:unnamed protein product [Timema poppensis]